MTKSVQTAAVLSFAKYLYAANYTCVNGFVILFLIVANFSAQPIDRIYEKKGHVDKLKCEAEEPDSSKCRKEEQDLRRQMLRDLKLEKARSARREQHKQGLEQIQEEIAHEKALLQQTAEKRQEMATLQQNHEDLARLKKPNNWS